MNKPEVDRLTERLEQLIASAHAAFMRGDVIGSLMLLQEAKNTAEKLPKKGARDGHQA